MSTVQAVITWFNKAKPKPTVRDREVQIGVHLEEIAEMLEVLEKITMTPKARKLFSEARQAMEAIAIATKESAVTIDLQLLNKEAEILLMDSIIDQAVTGIGMCTYLQQDYEGAFEEVTQSNWSKFTKEGKPIFLENGKIGKSPEYRKPNLEPYVGWST